jgi:hypothetical protein
MMLEELQRRNYAKSTVKTYLRIIQEFASHFHQRPDKLGPQRLTAANRLQAQLPTVVGIAPPAFFGDRLTDPAAFWIPIADEPLVDGTMITSLDSSMLQNSPWCATALSFLFIFSARFLTADRVL